MNDDDIGKLWGEIREIKALIKGADGTNGLSGRLSKLETKLVEAEKSHVQGYMVEKDKIYKAIDEIKEGLSNYKYKERIDTCAWRKDENKIIEMFGKLKTELVDEIKTIKLQDDNDEDRVAETKKANRDRMVTLVGILIAGLGSMLTALLMFFKGA